MAPARSSSPDADALDQAGLEALFLRLEKPVFNVVYRWLWDRTEARDVTQETFLELWRMRERVQAATVEPLAYRIAIHLASKRRRSRRLWRLLSLDAARDRPEPRAPADEQLVDSERQAAVRRAVDGLPERLRQVIVLCEFSGMSYAEMAAALGIPAGTVASRRNAAIRELERVLGRLEGEADIEEASA